MWILGEKSGSYTVANNRRSRLNTPQLFKSWIVLSIGQISIQWISIAETNQLHYQLDRDLYGGQRFAPFEELGPE